MKFKYMISYEIRYGYPGSESEHIVYSDDIYDNKNEMIRHNIKQIPEFKDATVKDSIYYEGKPNYLTLTTKDEHRSYEYNATVIVTPVLEINGKLFELKEIL